MDWYYSLYGLKLRADGALPGLVPIAASESVDVRIWLSRVASVDGSAGSTRWYRSPNLNEHGRPNLEIWRHASGSFEFAYEDQSRFLIGADGREIRCGRPPGGSIEELTLYLRGPVLGFALRLQGVVCLHASVVTRNDAAIAIVAPSGGGKSTTAAGFLQLGCDVLADDVAALRFTGGRIFVSPGYPRLNLWPDAAEALLEDARTLQRIVPHDGLHRSWGKLYLDLTRCQGFQARPHALKAVYFLGPRESGIVAPRIEPLTQHDAFMRLTEETYVNYALDVSMRTQEFHALGELVRVTPHRLAVPTDNPKRVPELCKAILADFEAVSLPSSEAAPALQCANLES